MDSGRCPVCLAAFRHQSDCSRCGADLRILMLLIARSFQLRTAARAALGEGEHRRALQLARQAQSLCPTMPGRRLQQASEVFVQLEGEAL